MRAAYVHGHNILDEQRRMDTHTENKISRTYDVSYAAIFIQSIKCSLYCHSIDFGIQQIRLIIELDLKITSLER